MLYTVPTNKVLCHNYQLPYNTKTCIATWKLETTATSNFVYVSLLKFISVSHFFWPLRSVIYVTNIQFH